METNEFKIARVKEKFLFTSYSKDNLDRLKKLAGKFVKVKRVHGSFYQIYGEDILVFRGDFKLVK